MDVTITASTYSGLVDRIASLVVSGESLSTGVTITQEAPALAYRILYTTTDSNPLSNITTSGWGATLVSNTYSGGQGVISFSSPVTSVPARAFYNKPTLQSVSMDDTVTSLGDIAFGNCPNLTGITLSSAITTMGASAFYGTGIDSFEFPPLVTTISGGIFSLCRSLTGITIPDAITSIQPQAFAGCTAMTNVVIGSGVTSIGQGAFSNCKSLTTIRATRTVAPSIEQDTFNTVASNGTLYYPSGANYSSWLNTNYWYLGFYNWTGVPY